MIPVMLMAAAVAANLDTAIGRWRTETRNGVVEIERCGPSICGRLVGSDGLRANPGLLDSKNRDAAQRGRRLMGIQMIGGFSREADGWKGGTIYNPDDGGTYKATVTIADADHLRLKGCIVWPLCKTQTWTRIR